jgi:23S rRNA pseudouridine1911/1915/1917 synthase
VPRTHFIELPGVEPIAILHEDRSVLAIDKPRGWMLVPVSWQRTSRNLQAALNSSIAARDFWARSRNVKYLRYIHRLDADTSGVMLLAKSPGALDVFSKLFETRRMAKTYLAVAHGMPGQKSWVSTSRIAPDPRRIGKMKIDARQGKDAETHFELLATTRATSAQPDNHATSEKSLILCKPVTGRTHQIRLHLTEAHHPIVGDDLYGTPEKAELGLRAVSLAYTDPFMRRHVVIRAGFSTFCQEYGFSGLKDISIP